MSWGINGRGLLARWRLPDTMIHQIYRRFELLLCRVMRGWSPGQDVRRGACPFRSFVLAREGLSEKSLDGGQEPRHLCFAAVAEQIGALDRAEQAAGAKVEVRHGAIVEPDGN